MRFAIRTFLVTFIPFALLLTGTFWATQQTTMHSVRNELRVSLRQMQLSMGRVAARSDLQNSRFLQILGDNASLKAGMDLVRAEPKSAEARQTLEEQLREISDSLHFDFLLASGPGGQPLAGVMRVGAQLLSMDMHQTHLPPRGFYTEGELTYQVNSVPTDQGEHNLGSLTVGERFDFAEFATAAVLTRDGKILKNSVPGVAATELEGALSPCGSKSECEISVNGQTNLALSVDSISFGDGYVLRTLQNVDAAAAPVQASLRNLFVLTAFGALLAAIVLTAWSSRTIVRPIARVVAHLRSGAETGSLPEFQSQALPILEIQELTDAFNRAAVAIRTGDGNLRRAYLEFVGSMASALDARDRYTAGHSRRVSEYACSVAEALGLPEGEIDQIRIGALLHDIGKIGINDTVLQKPGRLTDEEYALIQQHTLIGRRILEGIHGFENFLPIVELHHENWDGSGYPWGLAGEAVPKCVRIVHVVDAYEAMTSDRTYRRGMSWAEAVAEISRQAGKQFDPAIAAVFIALGPEVDRRRHDDDTQALQSISSLADALSESSSLSLIKEQHL